MSKPKIEKFQVGAAIGQGGSVIKNNLNHKKKEMASKNGG